MNQEFMKEKKILPLVISMSLPMVISMAVNSLYNIVDSYFVASISEDAMTALSLVYPIQSLMTAIAVGFGVGINAKIAFCLGANDKKTANQAASTGLLLSIIHGIILMVVCLAAMPWFLSLYTENQAIIDMALAYANRAFLFSVIIMAGICIEKVFQAVGRMKETMACMLVGFVANIVLDPLLIFGIGPFPEWGIAGAAYATGIGQTLTLLAYIIFMIVKPIPVSFSRKNLAFPKELMCSLYLVGVPATLNMALPSVLISALNGIVAVFSDKYILVLGAYFKLQTFIYLSASGVIQGIRPIVSYNYGAGEKKRVQSVFRTSLGINAIVMAVGMALSMFIPGQLIGIFTSSQETIAIGVQALRIISIGFIFSAVSVTCCGVLEALGRGMPSLVVSLLRYVVVIIPAAFALSRISGVGATGVFVAFPVTEIVTCVASYFIYRKYYKLCFK